MVLLGQRLLFLSIIDIDIITKAAFLDVTL
jgi:hypothetical protein